MKASVFRHPVVTFCVVVLIHMGSSPIAAQSLVPPSGIRRGEPAFMVFDPGRAGHLPERYTLLLRFADGSTSPTYHGFAPPSGQDGTTKVASAIDPSGRVILFLVSAPVNAALGEAVATVKSPGGDTLAIAVFAVEDRQYLHEDLWLDAALSSLRADPDPLKTAQALEYLALLESVNPSAAYLDGAFVRPVATERRTSLFATTRRYRYANGGVSITTHQGIDYGCPIGTPVVAAGTGRVAMAADRIVSGKTVILEHLPGTYTIYMHLDTMNVTPGDYVRRGAKIGTVGKTGLATGPHLHWELRVMGVASDPEALIGLDKMPSIRTIHPAIEGR
ncbi:MAG: peptidoglycan DD-metalloendopeptidase family protein [Spirochaetales bacterium]|nr:peptidoglycan DD-metalloendopeptidase family protein [Spirochaetales bacterium]